MLNKKVLCACMISVLFFVPPVGAGEGSYEETQPYFGSSTPAVCPEDEPEAWCYLHPHGFCLPGEEETCIGGARFDVPVEDEYDGIRIEITLSDEVSPDVAGVLLVHYADTFWWEWFCNSHETRYYGANHQYMWVGIVDPAYGSSICGGPAVGTHGEITVREL